MSTEPESCPNRAVRGGSWAHSPRLACVADRGGSGVLSLRGANLCFRLVRRTP